jgi:NAD+ kinase
MRRIGIFYNPLKETACSLARQVTEYLRERRLAVWLCSASDWQKASQQVEGTDLVFSVGGDGTILRAAQAVMPNSIPIVGINLGRLGFMTELSAEETMDQLPVILDGKGTIDERGVLEASVESAGRGETSRYFALNDIVIARGAMARLVNIEAFVDGMPLTTYRADGVVVATATGCTGYALAAGGPILHPQSKEFVIVPIVPHLSYSFPMVLPQTAVTRLTLAAPTPGIASIDGHTSIDMSCGDTVTVKQSSQTIQFIRVHDFTFYETLEKRLKGKQPTDAR